MDIVSDHLEQNALSVIQALRFIRSKDFFKKIDQDNYVIWADCGNHFRCYELMYFLFEELVCLSNFIFINILVNLKKTKQTD